LLQTAKADDANSFFRLKTIPGIGDVLALTLLYEIGSIDRFPGCGDFLSYARLTKSSHTSNGKKCTATGKSKIGNAYLRWAFGEAALLHKRELEPAARYADKIEAQHGKPRALHQLSIKLARAVYYMLKRNTVFDPTIYQK
jgi:transposase